MVMISWAIGSVTITMDPIFYELFILLLRFFFLFCICVVSILVDFLVDSTSTSSFSLFFFFFLLVCDAIAIYKKIYIKKRGWFGRVGSEGFLFLSRKDLCLLYKLYVLLQIKWLTWH